MTLCTNVWLGGGGCEDYVRQHFKYACAIFYIYIQLDRGGECQEQDDWEGIYYWSVNTWRKQIRGKVLTIIQERGEIWKRDIRKQYSLQISQDFWDFTEGQKHVEEFEREQEGEKSDSNVTEISHDWKPSLVHWLETWELWGDNLFGSTFYLSWSKFVPTKYFSPILPSDGTTGREDRG